MRYRTLYAVVALGALAACTDDPVNTVAPELSLTNASASTDPLSKENRLPPSLEEKVHLLRADLEGRGYEVARGYWTLWGVEECKYPVQTLGFCYGNNPTAPYVMAVVPRWKDEHVDQKLQHALLQGQRGMSAIHRLDEREALVVLAKLPPPARYFGLLTNVFTREATLNPNDPVYQSFDPDSPLRRILFATSPEPSRFMMISSIGNNNNNVVIQNRSGSVWNQQRFFVITPDQGMAEEMTEALERAGVDPNHVFTEPVSPEVARVGLDRHADDFITYMRYALPEDGTAGDEWRKQLPLAVLRVRDMDRSHALDPFPRPTYDPRSTNRDETDLSDDLKALVAAVKDRWEQPEAPVVSYFSLNETVDLVGQHCLGIEGPLGVRGPMNCLGDNQDADYQIGPSVNLDGDTVLAVVATLGTETGNATYASLSVNWFPRLVGLQNLSDLDLRGSAATFADVLSHEDRLFYVQYFARDCTGLEHCLEVPRKLIPAGETIKTIQRNYVNPGSARGPEPSKLLNPVGIILDGRRRPMQE